REHDDRQEGAGAGAHRSAGSHHGHADPRSGRLSGDDEMKRLLGACLVTVGLCSIFLQAQVPAPPPPGAGLTTAQIEKPSRDSWPTYNGDYTGRRFSSLTSINASNVKHLSLGWIYDLPAGGGGTVKGTPLLVDGVLYVTNPNHAYA